MGCARVNIGNRKTAQEAAEEATAYDANNLNQYTSIQTGEETAFVPTFDADGNQTKVQTSTGIWNVVYNAENRPVTFTSEDGATVVECTYDKAPDGRKGDWTNAQRLPEGRGAVGRLRVNMGRRITRKITVNGSVTNHLRYIYRGYLQIAAINPEAGSAQWFILWDPTQPVATRPLGIRKDGTWYTYGWDLTKNICEVFSSGGTILTAYTYTPYGAVTANGNVTQPIQWSSEYNDTELGLVYYNYRHYNPADGRWTGRDPYCAMYNYNLYCMCNNSIMSFYDRLGLAGEITHGIERCKDEDTCLSLSIKASKWIKAYSVRHRELAQDKYNYKQRDPRRHNNHIDKIEECKNHVKKCLTILTEKIKKNQCCKPGDRKPESIPNFSPKPTPERIPENNNFSLSHEVSQTDKVVEGVVYAGSAALASYVVYRAVRLLPSLFPLLWPTLVPNIVLP